MRRWQFIGALVLAVIQSSFLVESEASLAEGKKIIRLQFSFFQV